MLINRSVTDKKSRKKMINLSVYDYHKLNKVFVKSIEASIHSKFIQPMRGCFILFD